MQLRYCLCVSEYTCFQWGGLTMVKKRINKRAQPVKDDDILEEGDFVLDGYAVQIPTGQSKVDVDDLTIDQDDYELQQEEVANGMETNDAEPIAVDRYFRRIR